MAKRSPYLSDRKTKFADFLTLIKECWISVEQFVCSVLCTLCKKLKKDCFQNCFKIVVQISQNYLEQYKISFKSNQGLYRIDSISHMLQISLYPIRINI